MAQPLFTKRDMDRFQAEVEKIFPSQQWRPESSRYMLQAACGKKLRDLITISIDHTEQLYSLHMPGARKVPLQASTIEGLRDELTKRVQEKITRKS